MDCFRAKIFTVLHSAPHAATITKQLSVRKLPISVTQTGMFYFYWCKCVCSCVAFLKDLVARWGHGSILPVEIPPLEAGA